MERANAEYQRLKKRLAEIYYLQSASRLLEWDQETHMPSEGIQSRSDQLAVLNRIAHQKFTNPTIGKILSNLHSFEETLPYYSNEASLIRVTRRDHQKAVKVPSAFVAELANHTSVSYHVWTQAKPENNFALIKPYLEKTIELSRRYSDFFPGYDHVADPLIDMVDLGMKVPEVKSLFDQLQKHIKPIVQIISDKSPSNDACLRQSFPENEQLTFGEEVIKQLGYDFRRGRQDKTHHPFTMHISLGDVRITTHVTEDYFGDALFSTIHEAGHGMYYQGMSPELEGSPLAAKASASISESQARLWENIVGRSLPFWKFFYPKLQTIFPQQLQSIPLDTFYRVINKVEPSLIRTDADEITYNLHVMLRFELELRLLEGKLKVSDLPEAWRESYQVNLGIIPPDDKMGVLQDMHWYTGLIGYFQSYTLGNILSAQFFESALKTHPTILQEMSIGKFDTLRNWLAYNVAYSGRKYTTPELVKSATRKFLTVEPYLKYLKDKYGKLYGVLL